MNLKHEVSQPRCCPFSLESRQRKSWWGDGECLAQTESVKRLRRGSWEKLPSFMGESLSRSEKNTVAKSVVGWCEEQSTNVWNQRRKESLDFECIDWRRRKLSRESGRKRKERGSRWRIEHRLDLQHKWISGQSDSDGPRRGKNAAMKKKETCFGRKPSPPPTRLPLAPTPPCAVV